MRSFCSTALVLFLAAPSFTCTDQPIQKTSAPGSLTPISVINDSSSASDPESSILTTTNNTPSSQEPAQKISPEPSEIQAPQKENKMNSKEAQAIPVQKNLNPITSHKSEISPKTSKLSSSTNLPPFTGRITRNKVRIRLQPTLESFVIKELEKSDLVIVTGEQEEFYAIMPPKSMKGYVFRTFVLDGVVEGNHVNVRLEPDLNAPILAQFNQGDKVDGSISSANSKWLEVPLPEPIRFWITKEYVQRIGDASLYEALQKKRDEVDKQLVAINGRMQTEIIKPFEQIHIVPLAQQLQELIDNQPDLPHQTDKAKELLQKMQEAYLQRKIQSLGKSTPTMASSNQESPTSPHLTNNSSPKTIEDPRIEMNPEKFSKAPGSSAQVMHAQTYWQEIEKHLFMLQNREKPISMEEWYAQQMQNAEKIEGIIKIMIPPKANRPGDYILVNSKTNLTIAYLYSTTVDLNACLDKQVSLEVSSRPNNHYAFPAFYVLKRN